MKFEDLIKIKKEELGDLFNRVGVSLLTGSRSFGLEDEDSDWDTYILVKTDEELMKLKDELIKQNLIDKRQQPKVNIGPNKEITVIIEKASKYDKNTDLNHKFILLLSKFISGDENLFKQKKIEIEKSIDFDKLKKDTYLKQMTELRTLQSLFKRKISKPVAKSVIGEVTKRHMRLCILANNTIPPYDKWLYYKFKQLDMFKEAENYRKKMWDLQDHEDIKNFREGYFTFTKKIMPQKDYVGKQYWKYLRSDI